MLSCVTGGSWRSLPTSRSLSTATERNVLSFPYGAQNGRGMVAIDHAPNGAWPRSCLKQCSDESWLATFKDLVIAAALASNVPQEAGPPQIRR
eukprot:scaffold1377_cov126-Cylindrotheca_fusiformis.AAC.4